MRSTPDRHNRFSVPCHATIFSDAVRRIAGRVSAVNVTRSDSVWKKEYRKDDLTDLVTGVVVGLGLDEVLWRNAPSSSPFPHTSIDLGSCCPVRDEVKCDA